jgi:hypothetical protein
MLNPKTLEDQIKNALEQYLPPAFENAMFSMIDADGDEVRERCKNFGQTVSDMLSEPLASSIAAAIDYYVKNISISGTILTTGTPVTQQAVIVSPSPLTNGVVPNSLKIQ